MADLGVLTPVDETEDTRSKFLGELKPVRPGEHWSMPIEDEHKDLSAGTRLKLKTLADAGPATMLKNLENEGFEARHRQGMNFSIRKPGEKTWYVVDPSTFELLDDPAEFIGSIAPSVAGTIIGGSKGAAVGGTTLGPLGAVGGGIVGAGGGAAIGEKLKQGLGRLAGVEYVDEEAAQKVAMEGALGAGAQVLAPGLQIAGGAIKRGLFGEAGEVAARNLTKKEGYKKAVAATPEGAPFPAAPVMEEVGAEGLLPKVARKYKEARDVKTLLEAPKRKAREAFASSAPEVIEQAYKETQEASLKDLTRKAGALRTKMAKAQAKGDSTDAMAKSLKILDDARAVDKALKKAQKASGGVMPETANLTKASFVRQLAESAGVPTFGKSGDAVVKSLDNILTDKKFAQYLKTGQDPAVREAIERQVYGAINELGPEEAFFVKFARRGEKGIEAVPDERYFREMAASRDIPLDPAAWRQATRDIEGKTLDEMRQVLDSAGWRGEVPDSIEGITEALYRARSEGLTGVGMRYDPISRGLVGAESRGAGAVVDIEARVAGEQPRRLFGAGETEKLVTPTGPVQLGQEGAEQALGEMGPIQRAIAQPPGAARIMGRGLDRLRRGTSAGVEKAADVVGLPGKAFDVATEKLKKVITPGENISGVGAVGSGLGVAYATGVGPLVGKAIGIGIVSKLAAGGLRKMSSAIMADPKNLMALARKATGPVADKMRIPLQALQRRGTTAYKASVFSMLHDPEVRNYLQGLDKKDE